MDNSTLSPSHDPNGELNGHHALNPGENSILNNAAYNNSNTEEQSPVSISPSFSPERMPGLADSVTVNNLDAVLESNSTTGSATNIDNDIEMMEVDDKTAQAPVEDIEMKHDEPQALEEPQEPQEPQEPPSIKETDIIEDQEALRVKKVQEIIEIANNMEDLNLELIPILLDKIDKVKNEEILVKDLDSAISPLRIRISKLKDAKKSAKMKLQELQEEQNLGLSSVGRMDINERIEIKQQAINNFITSINDFYQ